MLILVNVICALCSNIEPLRSADIRRVGRHFMTWNNFHENVGNLLFVLSFLLFNIIYCNYSYYIIIAAVVVVVVGVVVFNPFASIGRTGTSNAKVRVMVICLNISFMTSLTSFFTPIGKKFKVFSKKKGLLIYLSSINMKLAINFLEKTFALGRKKGWRWKG